MRVKVWGRCFIVLTASLLLGKGSCYLYFPQQRASLVVLLGDQPDLLQPLYSPDIVTDQKHYFDFYWIPLDKGSEWISKIIEINPNTGQMSMNGNFKPRKLKIKGNGHRQASIKLCVAIKSRTNQSESDSANQVICQEIVIKVLDTASSCRKCASKVGNFITDEVQSCGPQILDHVIKAFEERMDVLFLHSSQSTTVTFMQFPEFELCHNKFRVKCATQAEDIRISGGEILFKNLSLYQQDEEESRVDLQCEIEKEGVKIKEFVKPVRIAIVSKNSNHPTPQEVRDLHYELENVPNRKLTLNLYNRELPQWKSQYQFATKCDFLKVLSYTSYLIDCNAKTSSISLNSLKICSSGTNNRVNFWNILFDLDKKLLQERFLEKKSSSGSCTLLSWDSHFNKVFNQTKEDLLTLTFSYERKSNKEIARNNTTDLLTELTTSPMSDNPIVLEQQEFKIAPSWRKFARLGSIGTGSKLNITTCRGGAAVERVALAGDILYLQEPIDGADDEEYCVGGGARVRVLVAEEEGGAGAGAGACLSRGWCSSYENSSTCNQACHVITGQRCHWRRGGAVPVSGLQYGYSTCVAHPDTCPDRVCDPLERLEASLCPQDCVTRASVLMGGVLVNTGRGRGLGSVRAPNMTCQCGAASCQCVHAEYQRTRGDTGAVRAAGGGCEDRCVLVATLGCSLVLASVLVTTGVWGSRRRLCGRLAAKQGKDKAASEDSYFSEMEDYKSENSTLVTYSTQHSSIVYHNQLLIDKKYEFPRGDLELGAVLGEGQFGVVVAATAINIGAVAVKMARPGAAVSDLADLVTEYNLLRDLDHPNVIRLVGACTDSRGPFYLILEYAELGCLRLHLRGLRAGLRADTGAVWPRAGSSVLSFARQIAAGMAYLAGLKVVHRDLAARNVLLARGGVCKISDFGLSRDVYVDQTYTKLGGGKVPVKWMAPECLQDMVYTSKSDVWSYGVLVWELVTLGAAPYPGLAPDSLLGLLVTGYRMDRPAGCPTQIYELMLDCWNLSPSKRPSFKMITDRLEKLTLEFSGYLDLQTVDYVEMNSVAENTHLNENPYLSPNDGPEGPNIA